MIRAITVLSLLTAGPAFAGDSVIWGEAGRNASLRVVMADGRRDPVLVHRVPQPTARHTWRQLSAVDASAERFVVAFDTARRLPADRLGIFTTAAGGNLKGPVETFGTPCGGLPVSVSGVAADGPRVAVGQASRGCGNSVTVHGPEGVRTVPAGAGGRIAGVALAGRYVAWARSDDGPEVVVHDLEAGATVLRISLGTRFPRHVALGADGTVAFSSGTERRERVSWATPGAPGVRTVVRAGRIGGLELAGGRVLYETRDGPAQGRRALVLHALGDGTKRRLARFTGKRQRIGDLDLESDRALWAVLPRGGRACIVVRDL